MYSKKWHVSRRTLLKGLGVSIALPYLDIMCMSDKAYGQDSNNKNFVNMYFDSGMIDPYYINRDQSRNKALVAPWVVEQNDNNLNFVGNLPATFGPLEPHKSNLVLFTELVYGQLRSGPADAHYTGVHYFASGVSPGSFTQRNQGGQSVDNVILENYRSKGFEGNALNFVEHRTSSQRRSFDRFANTPEYLNNLSFQKSGVPNPFFDNPRTAFNSLFGGNVQASTSQIQSNLKGKKIIDFLKEGRTRLNKVASNNDKKTLDQFYNSLSEIEEKVNQVEKLACEGASTAILGASSRDSFLNVLALAFQCGIAKTATYNNSPSYPDIYGSEVASIVSGADLEFDGRRVINNNKFHETIHLAHRDNLINVDAAHFYVSYNRYQVRAFSDLVQKLKELPTPNGNVFDNTLLFGTWDMAGTSHQERRLRGFMAGGRNTGLIGNKVNKDVLNIRDIHSIVLKSFGVPQSQYHNGITNISNNVYQKIMG